MHPLLVEYREVSTFLFSMLPVSELRGAIPFGVSLGLSPIVAFILSLLGNLTIIPILLLTINPLFSHLKGLTRVRHWIERFEARAINKYRNFEKYQLLGLGLFVAIPFPTTGVYTGCLVAVLLNLRFAHALISLSLGVVASGIIILLLTDRMVSIL